MNSSSELNDIVLPNTFAGNLPVGCPPTNAVDCHNGQLLRLVANNPPTAEDFISQCDEGNRKPPTVTECKFRGASYFSTEKSTYRQTLERLSKLDRFASRGKNKIATIQVSPDSGMLDAANPAKNGHFCLWRRNTFKPENHVQNVEVLT